jgi:hypothetical protein
MSQLIGGAPECDSSGQICNDVTADFVPGSETPPPGDLELLIDIALQQPGVQTLVDNLATTLPADNPYSTTTNVGNSAIVARVQETLEALKPFLRGNTNGEIQQNSIFDHIFTNWKEINSHKA